MAKAGIKLRPNYILHREVTGSPVAADGPAWGLSPALLQNNRWLKLHGFVVITGGTNPTVDIEQLTLANWNDGEDDQVSLIGMGGLQGLTSGQQFSLNTDGAPFLIRISAVSGDPTKVQFHMAGAPTND